MVARFKSVTALLAGVLVLTTAGCTGQPTPDIEPTVEARVKRELPAQQSKYVKPDPDFRIGWYIESIKNSPTHEDQHRLAISLLIDEARIDPNLVYFPNWPSLDEPSQSFDPAKAEQLFTELGDFRPWGKREFGRMCVVSSSKGDLQDRLHALFDDIPPCLET